jgi:pimeloyl-ACP methyl ester carboxylesterase
VVVKPFEIAIDPAVLDDLRERIARTRWPQAPLGDGWETGTEPAYLRGLLEDWRQFDWAAYERKLNSLPHFRHAGVHFVHVRGDGPSPLPIVLTHGWPGSFLEHLDLIPLLTRPDDPADAFDVVIPSLPGFGFSDWPTVPGVTSSVVADMWSRLMTEGLGYDRFAAYGSDIGAGVTAQLGLRHPEKLVGIQLSATAFARPASLGTTAEQEYFAWVDRWAATEGAYLMQHSTKPQSLGYGLTDSPAGLAGWIVEKYRDWADSGGDVDGAIGRERLLATLTLYWVTSTITPSVRMYYENRHHLTPLTAGPGIAVPAAFALFPNEFRPVPHPPRELAERFFQVSRWREFPSGGHFPAIEQPEVLAAEIKEFFRPRQHMV